ncbi:protein Gawky isoform X2 [Bemisia tabaci]|uniref:protein Gawky isoform X2 n=1 Tax=Bemisia tabaci TaxID=7038 RepID=UPI0008F9C071|nr:PREDICTED: protein Gawky isoform X2 [Bemisia tabaci]
MSTTVNASADQNRNLPTYQVPNSRDTMNAVETSAVAVRNKIKSPHRAESDGGRAGLFHFLPSTVITSSLTCSGDPSYTLQGLKAKAVGSTDSDCCDEKRMMRQEALTLGSVDIGAQDKSSTTNNCSTINDKHRIKSVDTTSCNANNVTTNNAENIPSNEWIAILNTTTKPYSSGDLLQGNSKLNHRLTNSPLNSFQDCDVIRDYHLRWNILPTCRLVGGGESSLASATSTNSGWGTNNNNSGSSAPPSGWSAPTNAAQPPPTSTASGPPANWNSSNSNSPNSSSQSQSQNRQPPANNASQGTNNLQNNASKANPAMSTSSNNQRQSTSQPPPATSQANSTTSWAQAAGKNLPNAPPTTTPAPPMTSTASTTNNNSTKQQLEQLNSMREALFSQDGWGGQHVNQDSGWDVSPSPEPVAKDQTGATVPAWKPNINNGTELWEANLRSGGQPAAPPQPKTPWGHTPTTNIGGTWGEDDDVSSEATNVWTGVPPNNQPQWTGGPNNPMWPGGDKKGSEWGGNNAGWPYDPSRGLAPKVDPRDQHRMAVADHRGIGADDRIGLMRGDPRGISGRLNGAGGADPAMWGPAPPPQQPPAPHHPPPGPPPGPGQPPNKILPPALAGVNHWTGPNSNDMNMAAGGGKPNGWDEPSPPAQRRNMPNMPGYDDGTALWGNQGNNKVTHWKEMPNPNMAHGMPGPAIPQNRMPGNVTNMKPDPSSWGHPTRNGGWGDGSANPGSGPDSSVPWGDDKIAGNWNEPPIPSGWAGTAPPKNAPGPWIDGDVDPSNWGHPPKQGPKPLTKDIIWSSKQFRILADMGFKKDDIENALRVSNMVLEDALEMLNPARNVGGANAPDLWRPDAAAPFDPTQFPPSQPRFPQQMPFAPPTGVAPSVPPPPHQKLLSQPPPSTAGQQPPHFNQSSRGGNSSYQPTPQQLRVLVQQITMAVQAGYLNQQILNQPLAPQTLLLLNQLLQHIKSLQQLIQQRNLHASSNPLGKSNNSAFMHLTAQITKTKKHIAGLQNDIVIQQAQYIKNQIPSQQHQQQHHLASGNNQSQGNAGGGGSNDFFNKNQAQDLLAALQTNFTDLNINKEPLSSGAGFQHQQSRLNQWKLPSLDKEGEVGEDFSRAPGTTSKSGGSTSPTLNPLLGPDGPWSSSVSNANSTGWPDSEKDWPSSQANSSSAFTDLVPEFEPGKPWKGSVLKSIEDDPSITPGSVVRSPLSLASIKDSEIFSSSKTSPNSTNNSASDNLPLPPLSLSSSTWSFNPSSTAPSSFTGPLAKLGTTGKTTSWGDAQPPTVVTSELWGAPKSRGPPPGLSSKTGSAQNSGSSSNGWTAGSNWSSGAHSGSSSQWPSSSSWLLLRNLTAQIDGSTLKTLCCQHGPLQNFHLYLKHGIALAKYSTKEEAVKAQGALNNCVLGNTTIFAESPAESEVHSLLQHLGQQGGSNSGWNRPTGGAPKPAGTTDTWSSGWPSNSPSSSLWGAPPLDEHRSTPSLNSFLPGDLLGGESM